MADAEATLRMVGAAGIEPATVGLEIRCSIQLSYERTYFSGAHGTSLEFPGIEPRIVPRIEKLNHLGSIISMQEELPANERRGWKSTSYSNLFRFAPSGTIFARFKVRGKQVRRSLGDVELAKNRLAVR